MLATLQKLYSSHGGRLGNVRRMMYNSVKQSFIPPLLLLLLVTFVAVPPVGDFPQNDDWVHAKAVERQLEHLYYRGHPFCTSSLAGQVYWGAAFAKVFGFSFNTLRASTLVLSVFLAWGVALCGREAGLPRRLALLCGALAWTSPIVLVLSYSFMLDVPFLTMTVLSGLFYLRAFRTRKPNDVFLGSLFGGLGYTLRQPALLLPIAYAFTAGILCLRHRQRPNWRQIVAFLSSLMLVLLVFVWVTRNRETGTVYQSSIQATGALDGVLRYLRFWAVAMGYIGLFAAPLGIARLWQVTRRREPARLVSCAFLALYTVGSFLLFWYPAFCRMPFQPSYLYDLGLAPLTLHDVYIENRGWAPFQIGKWWWLITLVSVMSGGAIVLAFWKPIRGLFRSATPSSRRGLRVKQGLFLLAWAGLLIGSLKNPWLYLHDRYLIAGIPPFLILLAMAVRWRKNPGTRRIAYAGAALMYAFSLAGTQDYMAWNRARWAAIDRLMDEYAVPVTSINGGYEFYGWYTSDDYMKKHNTRNFWDFFGDRDGRWVIDDTYVVGMIAPRPGYDIFFREPYFSWLGMETRDIYVFRRENSE